jgi:metallo-beta-lactamase family protein
LGRDAKQRGFVPPPADEVARLTFLGAAGEVTGSCFLLETGARRVLVECGLFQGERRALERNRRPFAFDPRGLDSVLLTHAHVDHSGLLPELVRDGFRGPIRATRGTQDLLGILLRDSAHLHEQDAAQENRRRLRRGARPIEPLYTVADAERALELVEACEFDQELELGPDLHARFVRAGHILGAASLVVRVRSGHVERTIVFSGDVGRQSEPLLHPPDPPLQADLLLLESTYGDRDHRDLAATLEELAQVLALAARDGGNVIVPVFAVGRAQEILHHMAVLEDEGRIPELPVFLDSPMAIHATELHRRHGPSFACEPREPRQLAFCRTSEDSMRLNERRGVVILSASGMCEGGRVLHHLRHNLWRETTDVVVVGFQARGTLGRALVQGARSVRIFGETVAVRAKVHTLGGFSAHAGQSELLAWSQAMRAGGTCVALVHGEPEKRAALAARLAGGAGAIWQPKRGDRVALRRLGEPVGFMPRDRTREGKGAHW